MVAWYNVPTIRAQATEALNAVRSGAALQWRPATMPAPPAAGLAPISPALLAQAVSSLPSPRQLADAATDAARAAAGLAQFVAPFAGAAGGALSAAAPIVGAIGKAAAPALGGIPYVGAPLAGAAALAGPIAAVGGVAGGVAGAAGGASPALVNAGADVVKQLDALVNPPTPTGVDTDGVTVK